MPDAEAAATLERAVRSTQTSASDFIELRDLQLASARQQEELQALRAELQGALR